MMRGVSFSAIVVAASLVTETAGQAATGAAPVSAKKDFVCGTSTYYATLSSSNAASWTRKELEELVKTTHQQVLPLEGVFEALIDLDGDGAGNVNMIYSGKSMPAEPYNEQDTWTREHLWSDTRGAVGGQAFFDIHNNRPEATRVTMIKGQMMFGECATVEFADVCEKPAFGGAPSDTSQDGKVWMPPASVRGDIARALFYMELRYGVELGLALSSCPPFDGKEGILSQLLEWHVADPVSDEELLRNMNACRFWQGNRNPFVDFPELVSRFWGEPEEIAPSTRTYPSCLDIPTPAPTAEQNECSELAPGDIFIYAVESDDPDGVGFLALENIPGGLDLYMTDNPWTGTGFASVEGVVKMTVPSNGIPAGKDFGFGFDFGANEKWLREEGTFNIGITGDSVFLYCYLGDSSINMLVGWTNSDVWAPAGLTVEEYGSEKSALPDQLKDVGSIFLPHIDNYRYEGPEVGEKADLQKEMMNPNNWKGNDDGLGDQGGSAANKIFATVVTTLAVVASVASMTYDAFF